MSDRTQELAAHIGKTIAEAEDSATRIALLQIVSELHLASLVTFLAVESAEHQKHSDCDLKYPSKGADAYLKEFRKDLESSLQTTCILNGLEYCPDPNKELRDEILNEIDT